MKSFTGKFSSARGWALLLALLLGAGMLISACGEEETPAPTTPAPPPPPPPAPEPTPEPEPTGPATPGNLRVTATTSSSITWTWDAVEGALGYVGQFSPDSAFTDEDQTFGPIVAPQTSYTVENLSGNMTGYFRVRSGAGTSLTDLTFSDWSDGVSGSTAAPPTPPPATALSAPTGLSVRDRGDNDIALEWNSVRDADHYEVEQRASGGAWTDASCGGNDNEVDSAACEATGLDEATSYNFRVRAVPANDDDTLTVSEWAELDDAVSTTGTPPRTTVTGGDDDLNMIWESEVDGSTHSITWIWDQVADRSHEYQLYYIESDTANAPGISDEDPCPKPTAVDGSNNSLWGARTFNTRIKVEGSTADTAGRLTQTPALVAGKVALLCVQTTWMDDRDVRQYGNLSWTWAATQPKRGDANSDGTDDPPVVTDDTDDRLTTSLSWPVMLDKGFDYEVRILSAGIGDDLPAKCDDGSPGRNLDSTADNVSFQYTVRSPTRYTKYKLCFRATNDDGESAWAELPAVATLPGTPPRPQYVAAESSITTTGTGNSATHAITKLVWTVSERTDQPRLGSGYDEMVVVSDDNSVTAAEVKAVCEATASGTDDAATGTVTVGSNNAISGITISANDTGGDLLAAVVASAATGSQHNIYACVRSKLISADGAAGRTGSPDLTGAWAISARQVFRKP